MTAYQQEDFVRIDTYLFAGQRFDTPQEAESHALAQISAILPDATLKVEGAALDVVRARWQRKIAAIAVEYDVTHQAIPEDPVDRRTVRTEAWAYIYLVSPEYLSVTQAAELSGLLIGKSITRQYIKNEIAVWQADQKRGLLAKGLRAVKIGNQYGIDPDDFWLWVSKERRGSRAKARE